MLTQYKLDQVSNYITEWSRNYNRVIKQSTTNDLLIIYDGNNSYVLTINFDSKNIDFHIPCNGKFSFENKDQRYSMFDLNSAYKSLTSRIIELVLS